MKRRYIALLASLLVCSAASAQNLEAYDQVTIFDSTCVGVEPSGLSHQFCHKQIKILNYSGAKENAHIKVDYDPLSAYVEIREVKVIHPDGTETPISTPVVDYVAPARLIYWGASQKMVEVGHLDPGDVLDYKTYRKGFTYALLADDDSRYIPPMKGHYYDIVPFWSTTPVLQKVYVLDLPKDKELQFKTYGGEVSVGMKHITSHNQKRTLYVFEKCNIMPILSEPGMLANNDIETKLLLSTSPDWETKSRWFYNVNEEYGSFKSTPALTQKVKEILKGAKTEEDSIAALTHWVADNMRYCGISMGEGEGYTLHNVEMNYTDRCGVCKDKASLLISMLRAAGFKAYAAMTMAHERIDNIPADQFNHSVSIVQRRDGSLQPLDPTWVPNVRELWSSAEQQQGYLPGTPEGHDICFTPVSDPENHYVKISGKSEVKKDGTLVGEFTITAEGQSDAIVRSVFSCRMSEWQKNLEVELQKLNPAAKITSVKYTNTYDYLKQPVKITYKYTIPNYAVVTDQEILMIPFLAKPVFARAMSHLNFSTALQERKYPFADRCSHTLEVNEEISLPKGFKSINLANGDLSTPENNDKTKASYNHSYSLEGNKLSFSHKAYYPKRVYEPEDWPAYRSAVEKQKQTAGRYVIIKK